MTNTPIELAREILRQANRPLGTRYSDTLNQINARQAASDNIIAMFAIQLAQSVIDFTENEEARQAREDAKRIIAVSEAKQEQREKDAKIAEGYLVDGILTYVGKGINIEITKVAKAIRESKDD